MSAEPLKCEWNDGHGESMLIRSGAKKKHAYSVGVFDPLALAADAIDVRPHHARAQFVQHLKRRCVALECLSIHMRRCAKRRRTSAVR